MLLCSGLQTFWIKLLLEAKTLNITSWLCSKQFVLLMKLCLLTLQQRYCRQRAMYCMQFSSADLCCLTVHDKGISRAWHLCEPRTGEVSIWLANLNRWVGHTQVVFSFVFITGVNLKYKFETMGWMHTSGWQFCVFSRPVLRGWRSHVDGRQSPCFVNVVRGYVGFAQWNMSVIWTCVWYGFERVWPFGISCCLLAHLALWKMKLFVFCGGVSFRGKNLPFTTWTF